MSTGKLLLILRGQFFKTPLISRVTALGAADADRGLTNKVLICSASTWRPRNTTKDLNAQMLNVKCQFLQPASLTWSVVRLMSKKGKSPKGQKKGSKKTTMSAEELDGILDVENLESDLQRPIEDLKEKFIHQLTLRTSAGVFDNMQIKTPDGNFPLIQLGQVLQKSPKLIEINLAASAHYISHVKDAIAASGLNVNPQQDKSSLFIQLPGVTKEHRESLAKNAKTLSESSKKSLRDIYSKCSKKIKASKVGHSADSIVAADNLAKDMMHQMVHKVEEMTASKQKELLGGKEEKKH